MSNYGYYEFVPLNMQEILLRVSQEDIFSIVTKPALNEFILSPLREDSGAGCYFEWYRDKLYFIDFGFSNIPLDCFGFISNYYGISHSETLKMINDHFQLGLGYSNHIIKPVIPQRSSLKVIEKKDTQILFQPRNYNKQDGHFWSPYGIKKSELIDDHVYAVKWFKVLKDGNQSVIRPFTPAYAYFEFKPRVKIYNPTTKVYKNKWVTNCNSNDIGNFSNIDVYGVHLLITKSYKDCRVLKNAGKKNTIWFQNEGTVPEAHIIGLLAKRFQRFSLLFDNDIAGLKAAERVMSIINNYFPEKVDNYTVPVGKDPAEMRKTVGQQELIHFLTKNHLLL